ncbi:MAG: PRD domain-containing protein [Lachnospiraceae bacterium]|nr:PRD domain-containing protein [Lachnospiraceae bacterium]
MVIYKILNNNAVLSKSEDDNEIIITGKGIAFQKKAGDEIVFNDTCRIFVPESGEISQRYQELIEEIPVEYINISEQIAEDAKRTCNKKIFDTIYLTLTDHIYSVCERYKEGIRLKNDLFFEIRRLYKAEFAVGERAVELLNRTFQMELLPDEAAFIAFHIVNSELNEDSAMTDMMEVTRIIQDVIDTVSQGLCCPMNEESHSYERFIAHLKYLAQRVVSQEGYYGDDDELFFTMCMKNPEAYGCIKKIKKLMAEKYRYDLSNEEQLYLLIHIVRLMKEAKAYNR